MIEPKRYRKKPVVVEAMQWTGARGDDENVSAAHAFMDRSRLEMRDDLLLVGGLTLLIPTLEGTHECRPGDWIIRGVQGEFYPCKPDIFEATYEAVE